MNHVVEVADLAVWVADHGEVHWCSLCFANVAFPFQVRLNIVNRQTDDFHIALVELGFDFCYVAKLSGAHWCEVFWVTKKYAPRGAEPLMKVDGALCGFCGEVGGGIAESKCHGVLL